MDLVHNGKLPLNAGDMVASYCFNGRRDGNFCMIYVHGPSCFCPKNFLSGSLDEKTRDRSSLKMSPDQRINFGDRRFLFLRISIHILQIRIVIILLITSPHR